MSELIRCSACRGTKKAAGLGGVVGECNLCKGTGKIEATERTKFVEATEPAPLTNEIVKQVSNVVHIEPDVELIEQVKKVKQVKIDPKKTKFGHKTKTSKGD